MKTLLAVSAALAAPAAAAAGLIRSRNMHYWLGSYVRRRLTARAPRPATVHAYFCFADHFEPYGYGASKETAHARLRRWIEGYRAMAKDHADADGRPPQHSYFYPEEEYDPEILDRLAELRRDGLGDVEIHLHHDNDTADGLREKIARFKKILHERHGFLRKNARTGEVEYGFIHGNWALDNSRPDGRWCGINDELTVLKETGCYGDFTMPSAPSDTQTRKINSLYFATDDPLRPKSHDTGRDLEAGRWEDDSLLMIQGPLALNWASRKWGLVPRIENAEISHDNRPAPARVRLWAEQAVGVRGRPDRIFIKVHSHGVQDDTLSAFFDGGVLDALYRSLRSELSPENGYVLHFVTAREMADRIKETCLGPHAGEGAKPGGEAVRSADRDAAARRGGTSS